MVPTTGSGDFLELISLLARGRQILKLPLKATSKRPNKLPSSNKVSYWITRKLYKVPPCLLYVAQHEIIELTYGHLHQNYDLTPPLLLSLVSLPAGGNNRH
jgi:hypothetical protein